MADQCNGAAGEVSCTGKGCPSLLPRPYRACCENPSNNRSPLPSTGLSAFVSGACLKEAFEQLSLGGATLPQPSSNNASAHTPFFSDVARVLGAGQGLLGVPCCGSHHQAEATTGAGVLESMQTMGSSMLPSGTAPSTHTCPPHGVKAVCGKRAKMEDAFSVQTNFFDLPLSPADDGLNKLPARIANQVGAPPCCSPLSLL